MMYHFLKYALLIVVLAAFGCSRHNSLTIQTPTESLPDSQQAAAVPESQSADLGAAEGNGIAGGGVPGAGGAVEAASEPGEISESASVAEAPEGPAAVSYPTGEQEEAGASDTVEAASMPENGENVGNGQGFLDSALEFVNASQEYWAEGNQDKAIAILDEAYALVIKVDTESNPDLFQQKEDLRYMISKRILEIYASRYTATNGNYNEIPLTLNEYVETEIKRFQGSQRGYFLESYRRSGRYMPMILQSLKDAGLPEDLAWLPLIESGFKVNALSSARALGLWQFIASTGQKFGLRRDTYVDERIDPEKATTAAISYLKELHQIFGDWTTVLAGYNCGEGRVLRNIRSQKINYLDNFWDLFQTLPYETARYVPRYLATLLIIKDPAKYGFELPEPESPVAYEKITINKPVQLKALAKAISVTEEELSDLNPELRHRSTPPAEYSLRVPAGKADALAAAVDSVPRWTPPQNSYVYHKVRKGETLSDIAVKYRTTVSKIVLANNIRKRDFIRIGQRLKVPKSGATVAAAAAGSKDDLLPGGKYRVRKGDSLWLIARRFNTNTKKIQQANGLKDTLLSVGQILIIPE